LVKITESPAENVGLFGLIYIDIKVDILTCPRNPCRFFASPIQISGRNRRRTGPTNATRGFFLFHHLEHIDELSVGFSNQITPAIIVLPNFKIFSLKNFSVTFLSRPRYDKRPQPKRWPSAQWNTFPPQTLMA
jgi:hypothetical protein